MSFTYRAKKDDFKNNLKSCPFCGSNDIEVIRAVFGVTKAKISCLSCECGTPSVNLDIVAFFLWQRRVGNNSTSEI